MKKSNILNIFLFIFIGLILISIFLNTNKNSEKIDLIEALNSDLKKWKDIDSLNNAKIQVLQTEKTKTFLKLKTNDSLVKELQKLVKKKDKEYSSLYSATIFNSSTNINTSTVSEIIKYDTIISNNTVSIYPTYSSKLNLSNWIYGKVISNKDSSILDIKVRNIYSITIGVEKKNIFSKGKTYVDIKNHNPYTETEKMRTYQVLNTIKYKKIGIGPVVGLGIDKKINPTFFIGFGLQYSIFKF